MTADEDTRGRIIDTVDRDRQTEAQRQGQLEAKAFRNKKACQAFDTSDLKATVTPHREPHKDT